jgi:hypothetical protein
MTEGRHARILVASAVALCCSLSACKGCGKSKPRLAAERPSLAGVNVKPIASIRLLGAEIQVDGARLSEKARHVLEDAQIFGAPEPNRPVAQVSLEAEVFGTAEREGTELGVKVHLRVTVRPAIAPARFTDDVEAVGNVPLPQGDVENARSVFQRLVERTVEDLLQGYVARQKLWDGSAQEIDLALKSSDNDLRMEATRIVAARTLREEIPMLLVLLSDEDENVRDAALGALVALREGGAVKALAGSRHMRDAREMRKILDAIATLGGLEAQEYLSFVAETHDDEEIREMAKEAMDRLTRRTEINRPTR